MKEIICSACHQLNPGSSKFCNHCGNILPPPDSIICPNCKASNPKKTYYCDECGTRLVTDKLGRETSPLDKGDAVADSIFSLPIRKPGDVGDFDPADLSSWVDKSADANDFPVESDDDSLDTVGLPDWLVNESDPILNVPKEITTEHYNLLINLEGRVLPDLPIPQDTKLPDWLTSDDSAEDEFSADMPTGATVPDWMPTPKTDQDRPSISGRIVADLSNQESDFDFEDLFDFENDTPEPVATPVTATADDGDDDWLSKLTDDDDDLFGEETAVSPSAPSTDAGLPDWLAEDAATNTIADGDDDWLNDLADGGDDFFVEETAVSPSAPSTDSDLPAWLAEDAATNTIADGDDDWLNDLADGGDDFFVEETAVSPSAPLADSNNDGGDWLSDLGTDGTDLFDSPTQSNIDSTLNWLDERTPAPNDDLDDIFAGTQLLDDDGLDWLAAGEEIDSPPLPVDDLFMASADTDADEIWQDGADGAELEDEPDWLTEYGTELLEPAPQEDEAPLIVEQTFIPAPLPEIDDDVEDFFATTDDDDDLEDFFAATDDDDDTFDDLFSDTETSTAASAGTAAEIDDFSLKTTEDDLDFAAAMLGDSGLDWVGDNPADVGDDLPDWLDDLGEIDEKSKEIPIEIAAVLTDVPEWLVEMQPGSSEGEGILSLSDTHSPELSQDDDFDSLDFDEDELSDLGMPDWLHENVTDEGGRISSTAITSNLVIDESIIDDLLDDDADFAGIDLSDLPPSIPLEDRLSKATIPDWIKEMKPAELTPEGAAPEPEPMLESAGSLVGIGGVIALQSTISPAYDDVPVNQFAVTKEHQQQVALLRQLRQGERKLSSGMAQADAKTSARMRIALIAVVLFVALVGLFGPSLVTLPTAPSPALVAVHDELTAVSNQPVLVAFEYTPAMAGELNAQAETLLATLAENGSPVVAVSQSAAGSTIAAAYLPEDGMQIGMVTGGAAGLRQLADCVNHADSCTTLLGREVTADERAMLGDAALIIVLTGERDSMVNWIEQVGTPSGLPLLMGLTTAIAPLAAPYHDSGQIAGMMKGLTETAVYQQEWQATADSDILSRLNAQALLQLTAALLLIAGSIYYGVINAKKKK